MAFAVDGIAFDVGNTLILDPFETILRKKALEIKKAFSESGYSFYEKQICDAWSDANDGINYPFICHFYQERPVILQCLKLLKVEKAQRPKLATDLLVIYRNGLKYAIVSDSRIGSLKNVLSQLRSAGKRLVVFGNGRQRSHEIFLSWTGLLEYFDVVTASEKIGIEKPNPRAFSYILKALGTVPERSAYVGDDPANDIGPAKEMGMYAVQYVPPNPESMPWRNYNKKIKQKPDAVIRRFEELLEILK